MVEVVQKNLLEERHRSALESVRTELERDAAFQLVSENEASSLLKLSSAIWRTRIHALEKDWTVDIGLPRRFPDEAPIAYVSDWEKLFLRNPHVLKGGFLCTIPSSAALDSSDPVGLVRYVYDKAKEILDGTSMNDFREEFSYYWNRCTTEGTLDVLIIDPIEKLGKVFSVIFLKGYVLVASSVERLNRWISNRTGKTSELEKERLGISINLKTPLLPQDYPKTLTDLVALAEANDTTAAGIINNHILTSNMHGLALLVQKEGEGEALGGVIFKGVYSSKFAHGFRKKNVPADQLRREADPLIRSTKVTRSKVIRVDHRWIHSRGGDGRDLSSKAVLLIGCGSLGGYVAHLLSRAGVGRLTVADNDILGWENLGRHILGASSLRRWKAEALAEELTRELPHLEIIGIRKDWRDIFESNQKIFSEHDLIISTVADWRCERPLNNLARKTEMPPLLLGWLEPHAVAGHCLVIARDGGCFECSANRLGRWVHQSVASFKEDTIYREPGGCAYYQHYGPIALMPVASMIASVAVESLLNIPTESFLNTWISSKGHLDSVGANLTETWKREVGSKGYSKTFKKQWNKSNSCRLCMYTDKLMNNRCYTFPNSEHQLVLTPSVLEVFSTYCQKETDPETGGLLFAEFDFPIIRVVEASAPRKSDKRWRTLFIPNRILQRQLIKQRFKKGHHFVGEWHTHPTEKPTPSLLDLKSTADSFLKSRHELNYFIMVIVGNIAKNFELWVSIHDGLNHYRLKAS